MWWVHAQVLAHSCQVDLCILSSCVSAGVFNIGSRTSACNRVDNNSFMFDITGAASTLPITGADDFCHISCLCLIGAY